MRSTTDQLQEIMKRADVVKEKRVVRKKIQASVLATCLCAALLIAVSIYLPNMPLDASDKMREQYGSLLLGAPYMGYIIVGILAFALGICSTLLCIFWKELKKKEQARK